MLMNISTHQILTCYFSVHFGNLQAVYLVGHRVINDEYLNIQMLIIDYSNFKFYDFNNQDIILVTTSLLRLLALRVLRTPRVRTQSSALK